MREIHEEDRKPGLIHLDTVPVRRANAPHVLRPVPVGFLRDPEVGEHPVHGIASTGREQSARTLNEVAGPDEMITAEIAVDLGETPRTRKDGEDPYGKP